MQGNTEYDLNDAEELITLVYQLLSVKRYEMAMDVLKLNLHAFPEHRDTMMLLAKLSTPKDA